jgi:hypothetical protein
VPGYSASEIHPDLVAVVAEPAVGGTLGIRELLSKLGQGEVTIGLGTGLIIDLDRCAGGRVGHPDSTGAVTDDPGHVDP